MKGLIIMRRVKSVFITVFLVLITSLLASCSLMHLFQSDVTPRPQMAKLVTPPQEPPAPDLPYCEVNLDYPLSAVCNPKLYIYKSDRKLLLINNGVLIREYRIALGPSPNGDKLIRGDGRTPEGEFYICAKNPTSRFYKSLGISYPAPKHAEKALDYGAISMEEFREILAAADRKKLPPGNTVLGGDIFIHGGGAYEDWTKGCIAVRNSAMDELFEIVAIGTPVEVKP